MTRYVEGNSGDMAIMEINHKKKKVILLNSETRKPFEEKYKMFEFSFSFLLISIIIFLIVYFTTKTIVYTFLLLVLYYCIYSLIFMNEKRKEKLHLLDQYIFNDLIRNKKYIKIDKIDNLIYQLPYNFKNIMLNYKLSGDFKRYIIKVVIDFKEYEIIQRFTKKKILCNDNEWGVWFYFENLPKNGSLEITWV